MIPVEKLGRTQLPDGTPVELHRRGEIWFLLMDRIPLWSSDTPSCAEAMASLSCEVIARKKRQPRVLIQDLGLGQALKAVLKIFAARGRVTVSETCEGVVAWHRGVLADITDNALQDERVMIESIPLADVLKTNDKTFDVVLVDLVACFDPFFENLNSPGKLRNDILLVNQALRDGGMLVVRSEQREVNLVRALEKAGFSIREEMVSPNPSGKGRPHCLTLAKRRAISEV